MLLLQCCGSQELHILSTNLDPFRAQHITCLTADGMPSAQVQAALKSKGLRDDITVLVIDAMPDDSFRLPPFLAKQNGGYAVTLEDVGSVDWHKPLDEAAAADACASNTW
jgi:hypothetical protein